MNVYQVFHSNDTASGNFAAIAIDDEVPAVKNSTLPPYLDPDLPEDLTHCHIEAIGPSCFSVDCYQSGQQIQCCGHGLLACAHILLDLSTDSQISLGPGIFAERSSASGAAMQTWLRLPCIESLDIEPPNWTAQLFSPGLDPNHLPVSAAVTSNADGYLLLQLPDSTSLSKLDVNIDIIIENTGRAILLWQRSNTEENLIGMRYFAPQYGKSEDAATGSVLRVLGPYLSRTQAMSAFSVIQHSETGGEMLVINKGDCVAISGNTRLVKNTNASSL